MKRNTALKPAWDYEACRADMLRQEAVDRTTGARWPRWAVRLCEREQSRSLVTNVEEVVASALAKSGAIDFSTAPHVRLKSVAALLGARLRFATSGLKSPYRSATTARIIRTASEWVISVSDRNSPVTRESVAHELGHALLYWTPSGTDTVSWRNSQWTLLEECVCNYIGRLILAPKEVALPFRDGNLATQIIDLAGRLWLTPKTAALRWLDFAARDDYQPIVVLWRQYHPFDQGLVDACFRTVKQQRNDLREAANQLRQAFPSAPFGEALQIWRKTFGVSDVDQRTFGSVVLTEAQREAIAFLETVVQKNRTISAESMREITNPESNRYFRPEWTLWPGRPLGAFVPVRRGSARHGSTVSRLATGQTEDRSNEAVEIGSINGSYEIDAFGHGVARDGSRYIVQVLSRLATQRATS